DLDPPRSAGRPAATARGSPVLHARLGRVPHQAGPIAAGLQLFVADGAQQLFGLGRAQPALSPAAAPGPPARRAAPPTPTGRRLVLAATAVLDRELEVPFRRAVVRPQQQGFAVRALARRNGTPSSRDRKSTRLNSSHASTSYAVFCLQKNIHCKLK